MEKLQDLLRLIDTRADEQAKNLGFVAPLDETELPSEQGNLKVIEPIDLTDVPAQIGEQHQLRMIESRGDRQAENLGFVDPVDETESPSNDGNLTVIELINRAAKEQWKELDLTGMELTELPAQIGELHQLEKLILGKWDKNRKKWIGNELKEFPLEIFNLTNLVELNISNNKIERIPPQIAKLTNLTVLDLWNNQIEEIPPEIASLTKLTRLRLWNNQIEEIPPEISQLTNLIDLGLSDNQIRKIPAAIGSLTNLEKLGLWNNQIEEICLGIGKLTNLTELYLWSNQIEEIPVEIANLTNLTSLGIGENKIHEIPAEIASLIKLEKLYLSNNQITKTPPEIGELINLTKLYLSNNQIVEISRDIFKLTNLVRLDLSNNCITEIPREITKLANLKQLWISNNQIDEIPPQIARLTKLKEFYISNNQIAEIPPQISRLTSLTEFYISNNQIAEIPPQISRLTSLSEFDLSKNQIREIPPEIGNLTSLTGLDLSDNQIVSFPIPIAKLTNLKELYLSQNQIGEIPPEIGNLTSLIGLDLSGNQIKEIPPEIAKLTNLTKLYLWDNQISEIPNAIANLTNLTKLYLWDNEITKIPDAIASLTKLTKLYLWGNLITEIPDAIAKLTNLQELDINSNKIKDIPQWFQDFKNLQKLDLRSNPILIPQEILGTKEYQEDPGDLQAILSFYFQTQDPNETEFLYEAKLIIVGEGEVGKTTLAKKLQDVNYVLNPNERSTQGIDVTRWKFDHSSDEPFHVNTWDFGGQEIYHATHQFFLTERSLYALVIDSRREHHNLYYWLNVVRLFSDNSPIFIIKNEKQDRQCDVNEPELRSEFVNLQNSVSVNLATDGKLTDIRQAIKQHITTLPHINIPVPKKWVRIRNTLENYAQNHNYISVENYYKICKRNGLKERKEQLEVSKYLHNLGVFLHFQDDVGLKNLVILQPTWATNAVYKVTDTKSVKDNNGSFTKTDLHAIWHQRQYLDMHDELLQLMQKFRICYPIRNSSTTFIAPDTFIVPSLLPLKPPDYTWDEAATAIVIRYKYSFMPKGIVTRFIVEIHDLIEHLPEPAPTVSQLVWKNGVILNDSRARAEVIEYYGKEEICIRVVGSHKKTLLAHIRREFDKIHSSYEVLKYKELIPCNCHQCKNNRNPYTYEYARLLKRLDIGQYMVECDESYLLVNIRSLIDDVIAPTRQDDLMEELTIAEIRQLIETALTDDELSDLCMDEFPKVFNEFTEGQTKSAKIRSLVDYADRQGELDKLLAAIERINSHAYHKLNAGKMRSDRSRDRMEDRSQA